MLSKSSIGIDINKIQTIPIPNDTLQNYCMLLYVYVFFFYANLPINLFLGGFNQAQTHTPVHRTGCTPAATLIGNTETVLISTDEEVQVQKAEVLPLSSALTFMIVPFGEHLLSHPINSSMEEKHRQENQYAFSCL